MKFYEYVYRDSLIHNLDPRTKLIWLFALSTLVFLTSNATIIFGVFVLVLVIALIAKLPWSNVWNSTKLFVLLLPISYVLLFIWVLGNIQQGIYQGMVFTIKFWVLIFSTVIFTMATSARDLLLGLSKLKIPFEFAFMITIAIRFIPVISKEINTVISAQRARAYEISWEWTKPIDSLKKFIPILIPLIMLLLKRSYELAIAIESRAFRAKKQRTFPKRIKMKMKDWLIVILCITLLGVVWIYRI